MTPIRVLFLCHDNSCRSQMAEGFLRRYGGDAFEVVSAGLQPKPIHPQTIDVMARSGVDISHHRSRPLTDYRSQSFDFVITVCDRAQENCAAVPSARRMIHWQFVDPSQVSGTSFEVKKAFMRTRDEIASRVRLFADAQARRNKRELTQPVARASG
jgi:arsenate reductase (thioredoxin)